MKYKDESGKIFGELTAIKPLRKNNRLFWVCRCSCGTITEVVGHALRSGTTKSCGGCGRSRKKSNPTEPVKRLYRSIRSGAKRRKLQLEITFEEFLKLSKLDCYYCGESPELKFGYTRRRYSQGKEEDISCYANGLDRVDSSLGYTLENVVPCCRICNVMKLDQTLEEFFERIGRIYERKKNSENCSN